MGVHGLWGLLEPVGQAIPLETLENQIVAIGKIITMLPRVDSFYFPFLLTQFTPN